MGKKRRSYTAEFKRETVRLVREQGLSYAQAGRDLGIHKTTIRDWVKKAEAGELEGSPGAGDDSPAIHEELRRLRKENAILKEEREILKKAAAFFAKETR